MKIFCTSRKQPQEGSYAGKFTPRLDQSNSEILNDLIKQKKDRIGLSKPCVVCAVFFDISILTLFRDPLAGTEVGV